ncbi:MAG: helix-turn-helix transcriptional regulator, partial [Rhizorhabdus sp.]
EALIAAGDFVLAGGRPLPRDASVAARIAMEAERLRSGLATGAEVVAPSIEGPIRITLSRLPQREWQFGFAPYVLMSVSMPPRLTLDASTRLQDTFGLTRAELAVAQLMMAGHRRDAIARTRGTTSETLRSQLRSIFSKLGVRREAEAIGLLHTFLR